MVKFSPKQLKNKLQKKTGIGQKNISRKGKYRSSKFNEAHPLTALEEGNYVLVNAVNESEPKRKLLKKFLQIYEGPYEIKRQVRAVTYILRNPESKEERGMFHSPDLKIYNKREDDLNLVKIGDLCLYRFMRFWVSRKLLRRQTKLNKDVIALIEVDEWYNHIYDWIKSIYFFFMYLEVILDIFTYCALSNLSYC